MAFTDNFTRADSSTLGSNYSDPNAVGTIVSNQAVWTGAGFVFWIGNVFNADQTAEITIVNHAATQLMYVFARCQSSVNINNCYVARTGGSGNNPRSFVVVAGSFTVLHANEGPIPVDGDSFLVSCVSNVISWGLNGVIQFNDGDSTFASGGCVGFGNGDGASTFDTFNVTGEGAPVVTDTGLWLIRA